MPLDQSTMDRIKANITTLDYLKGTGVLSDHRRKLTSNEYYIFVGAGGTGTSAVKKIKERLQKEVESSDLNRYASFLCVDTDHKFLDQIIIGNDKIITENEVAKLPFNGVLNLVWPITNINTYIAEWIHKDLPSTLNADAAKLLSGDGAGSFRQIGRLLLSNNAAWNELNAQISRICGRITNGDKNTKIRVFYLSGIAGGTGSGTVIDLPYILRDQISTGIPVGLKGNVRLYGYILMPSASNKNAAAGHVIDGDHTHGEINGYAALKEIDHFMTLKRREERFQVTYGPFLTVNSGDNLFDFCTLVEGGGAFSVSDDPHTSACNVISDSILNIICENISGKKTLTDSFLSDSTAKTGTIISGHSDFDWPRDANYIYSVMGYSSCVVPKDLLTVQVMYKVFTEMYKKFSEGTDITDADVKDYIAGCGLAWNSMVGNYRTYANRPSEEFTAKIQRASDDWFKDFGPYFMVNLTQKAVEELKDLKAESDRKQNGFLSNTQKYHTVSEFYEVAISYIESINHGLYEVYTYAIDQLKVLIEENAGILTETHEYENVFGNKSFCWSPIDLRNGQKAKILIENKIFGDVYNDAHISDLVGKFIDALCEKKEEWTAWGITNTEDKQDFTKLAIAKAIRDFIKSNIKAIVNESIEDLLVKLLTNNPTASVKTVYSDGADVPSEYTKQATDTLYKYLSDKASPLASARADGHAFYFDDCYKNVYITVPDNCQWLIDCLKAKKNITVFETDADDSISLYRLYDGVPAWALDYTEKAEEQYEKNGPTDMGLHMEQSSNSKNNWQRLPNLCPENTWSPARVKTGREKGISSDVNSTMAKARKYGVVIPHIDPVTGSATDTYDAYVLDNEVELDKAVGNFLQQYTNQKVKLINLIEYLKGVPNVLQVKPIVFVNQVMTDPTKPEPQKDAFRYSMACRTIRRLLPLYDQLKRMCDTISDLQSKIDEHNDKVVDIDKLILFINCLASEFFKYDKLFKRWTYYLPDEKVLAVLPKYTVFKTCPHYIAFKSFSQLDDSEYKAIENYIDEKDMYRLTHANDSTVIAEMNAINDRKAWLKTCIKKLMDRKHSYDPAPWPDDSEFADANTYDCYLSSLQYLDRIEKAGYDIKEIREFYNLLDQNC